MQSRLLNFIWHVTIWMLLLVFFAIPANYYFSKLVSPDQWEKCALKIYYLLPRS